MNKNLFHNAVKQVAAERGGVPKRSSSPEPRPPPRAFKTKKVKKKEKEQPEEQKRVASPTQTRALEEAPKVVSPPRVESPNQSPRRESAPERPQPRRFTDYTPPKDRPENPSTFSRDSSQEKITSRSVSPVHSVPRVDAATPSISSNKVSRQDSANSRSFQFNNSSDNIAIFGAPDDLNNSNQGEVKIPKSLGLKLLQGHQDKRDPRVFKAFETLPEVRLVHVEPSNNKVDETTYSDGIYSGTVRSKARHGWGVLLGHDHTLYEGTWTQNTKDGNGRMITTQGAIISGQWKKDKQKGEAHVKFANGCSYQGYMFECKPQGQGVYIHSKYRYVGQFQNGHKHGKGKIEFRDNSVFDGTFTNGKKQGLGTFKWPDGSTYSGGWENNHIQGDGTFNWINGEEYKGQFAGSKRHGVGEMKYEDGSVYFGHWNASVRSGEGKITYKDGSEETGIWDNDELIKVQPISEIKAGDPKVGPRIPSSFPRKSSQASQGPSRDNYRPRSESPNQIPDIPEITPSEISQQSRLVPAPSKFSDYSRKPGVPAPSEISEKSRKPSEQRQITGVPYPSEVSDQSRQPSEQRQIPGVPYPSEVSEQNRQPSEQRQMPGIAAAYAAQEKIKEEDVPQEEIKEEITFRPDSIQVTEEYATEFHAPPIILSSSRLSAKDEEVEVEPVMTIAPTKPQTSQASAPSFPNLEKDEEEIQPVIIIAPPKFETGQSSAPPLAPPKIQTAKYSAPPQPVQEQPKESWAASIMDMNFSRKPKRKFAQNRNQGRRGARSPKRLERNGDQSAPQSPQVVMETPKPVDDQEQEKSHKSSSSSSSSSDSEHQEESKVLVVPPDIEVSGVAEVSEMSSFGLGIPGLNQTQEDEETKLVTPMMPIKDNSSRASKSSVAKSSKASRSKQSSRKPSISSHKPSSKASSRSRASQSKASSSKGNEQPVEEEIIITPEIDLEKAHKRDASLGARPSTLSAIDILKTDRSTPAPEEKAPISSPEPQGPAHLPWETESASSGQVKGVKVDVFQSNRDSVWLKKQLQQEETAKPSSASPGDSSAALNRPRRMAKGKVMKKIKKSGMFSLSLYKEFFKKHPMSSKSDFLVLLKEFKKFRPDDEIELSKKKFDFHDWHKVEKGWYYGEKDDKGNFCGLGILVTDKIIYEGYWKNNSLDQFGRYISLRNIYTGRWENGKEHGFGTFVELEMGHRYVGDFHESTNHGQGFFQCDSFTYQGDFVNHKKQGTGEMIFSNGDTYTGDFFNDEISGFGTMKEVESCETYTGEWDSNKKHGKGVIVKENGDTYTGNFSNGNRQGLCKLRKGDKEQGLKTAYYRYNKAAPIPKNQMPAANLDLAVSYSLNKFKLSPQMFSDDEGEIPDKAPQVPHRLQVQMGMGNMQQSLHQMVQSKLRPKAMEKTATVRSPQ